MTEGCGAVSLFQGRAMRAQTKDESRVPLTINCWPSVSGGDSYVNIEYEAHVDFDLQNVVIAIPCHTAPRVNEVRRRRSSGSAH